jgi:GYF domain 2
MRYWVLGSDQTVYGPVDSVTLQQWLQENRLQSESLICIEGSSEWKPISETIPPNIPSISINYKKRLNLGECFASSSLALRKYYGRAVGAGVIGLLLLLILVIADAMLLFGLVIGAIFMKTTAIWLIPFVLILPAALRGMLWGGIWHFYVSLVRGAEPVLSDIFEGFKRKQLNLIALSLITTALTFDPTRFTKNSPDWLTHGVLIFSLMGAVITFLLIFVPPLIMDRNLSLRQAIKVSSKMVVNHFGKLFVLAITGLFAAVAALMMCIIPVFFIAPFALSWLAYAYHTLSNDKTDFPAEEKNVAGSNFLTEQPVS